MFGEKFRRKYALSNEGVKSMKKGTCWTAVVNIVVMGGIGIFYWLMYDFMGTLTDGDPLPKAWIFILAAAAYVILSLITHMQQYAATYSAVYGEVRHMRLGLAERMRKLPLGFFGRRDLADMTETIMGDVNRMEHVWSHVLGYLYGSWISTIIIAAGLFVCDWRMAIACLWGVPAAFLLMYASRKMSAGWSKKARARDLAVSDGIQETIETIREIHSVNGEKRALDGIDTKIDEQEKYHRRSELATGIFVNGASVIMRLGVATTILAGTGLIVSGKIDFMLFFMFMLVITRIYAPFDQSLALTAELFVSEVSARRLNEIYDTKTAEGSMEFRPEGHDIVFSNVGFAYNEKKVLENISFTAEEGQVTALVGPSGSGKSTCARLAARLWDASEGTITMGGVDISTIDPEVLTGDYAMVFQNVMLFDDTVMENIRLGKHGASDEEVLAAAEAANCDEFVHRMPQGYSTYIGENGVRLSGGERQRISIARALLKDAPVVLLDEATASLDVESETKVQEALSKLLEGKTVMVIAHRMRTVENADKIVVLADGRVAEEGSPAELYEKKDSIFRHMRDLQMQGQSWRL